MKKPHIYLVLRLMGYLILQVIILATYVRLVDLAEFDQLGDIGLEELLRENELLEWVQISTLIAILALSAGSLRRNQPALHRLLFFAAFMALFRELDSFLGDFVDESHRIGIIAGGIGGLATAWIGRSELPDQIAGFLSRPGLYLLLWGASFVTIYSQLMGQREIWDFFAHEEIANLAKRFVEEGLEFMGYIVIACGVFEERFFGLKSSAPTSTTPA